MAPCKYRRSPYTRADSRRETVRKALRTLVKDGLLDQHGGRGRTTTYSVRT